MAGNLLATGIAGAASIAISKVNELGESIKQAVIEATTLAIDFESQVAGLQIAARESGLAYDELHDAALMVGGDTRLLGVSATGAADAMTGLYKAGLTTAEIFGDLQGYMAGTTELGGALRAAIDLAAATELDMVQASDLAAIALATFGGELKTSEERAAFVVATMDNLVKAADASVAEVSGLGHALTFVGSTFAAAGYPVEDMNNSLAILSNAGLDAGRAGRNLQSMITSLINPTSDGTEALAALNTEIYNADGSMRPLRDIIGDLAAGTADLTQQQTDQALGQLFTNAGIRAALPLIAAGTEGWDAMAVATENATGIQEQAAIKAATMAGRMEALQGNLETLKIEIGEELLPILTDLVNWMIPVIDQYGPYLIAIFDGLAEAARWVWEKMQPLKEPVQELMSAFDGLAGALGLDEGEGGWLYTLFSKVIELNVEEWISSLISFIEGLTMALDAAKQLIEWISGERGWQDVFLDIKLPDWLVPGSPTPLELGLRGITEAMTDLSRIGAPQLQAALTSGGSTTNHNYYLTAQYQNQQSEGSLMADVRALSVLTGA
jgi:TP901 family phage tail tape measure protein